MPQSQSQSQSLSLSAHSTQQFRPKQTSPWTTPSSRYENTHSPKRKYHRHVPILNCPENKIAPKRNNNKINKQLNKQIRKLHLSLPKGIKPKIYSPYETQRIFSPLPSEYSPLPVIFSPSPSPTSFLPTLTLTPSVSLFLPRFLSHFLTNQTPPLD